MTPNKINRQFTIISWTTIKCQALNEYISYFIQSSTFMKGRYYNIILLLLESNPQKLRWVTPISGRRVTLIKPLCRSSVFLLHHDASSSKCLLRVLWICVAFKVPMGIVMCCWVCVLIQSCPTLCNRFFHSLRPHGP